MLDELKEYIKIGNLLKIKEIVAKHEYLLLSRDESKDLPIHYAAQNCPKDCENILDIIAELLPADSEDINSKGSDGNTIFHIAIKRNIKILIDSIIDNGGDPSIKNNDGKSPESYIQNWRNKYHVYICDIERNYNKFLSCNKSRKNNTNEMSFVDKIKDQRKESLNPGCSVG